MILSPMWENRIVGLALTDIDHRLEISLADENQTQLAHAYSHCKALTAYHSKSFSMAAALLPKPKKRAVHALYAFCRVTDDIADDFEGDRAQALECWRMKICGEEVDPHDDVALAWLDTLSKFDVPAIYAQQLIDGVKRDLSQNRYENFEDLVTYCYGVASTVGLMSMHIVGFKEIEAVSYAVKLGVALQLTNILRDVREDWERNRIYLPKEELESFGLTEEDIARGVKDRRWREMMRFQINRAHLIYEEAWPGIRYLNREGRFAIAAAAAFYRDILSDIESHDYDVFSRRAYVSKWAKMRRLPALWWQHGIRD